MIIVETVQYRHLFADYPVSRNRVVDREFDTISRTDAVVKLANLLIRGEEVLVCRENGEWFIKIQDGKTETILSSSDKQDEDGCEDLGFLASCCLAYKLDPFVPIGKLSARV